MKKSSKNENSLLNKNLKEKGIEHDYDDTYAFEYITDMATLSNSEIELRRNKKYKYLWRYFCARPGFDEEKYNVTKKRKKKKKKNEKKIKKNSYNLFVRENITKKSELLSNKKNLMIHVSKLWKSLSIQEKEQYNEKAKNII